MHIYISNIYIYNIFNKCNIYIYINNTSTMEHLFKVSDISTLTKYII